MRCWKPPVLLLRQVICSFTRMVVIQNQATRDALRRASHDQPFLSEAPVCIAFCADPQRSAARFGERGAHLYALQDVTIAAGRTTGHRGRGRSGIDLGRLFRRSRSAKPLGGLADGCVPVALLSVGYPAELAGTDHTTSPQRGGQLPRSLTVRGKSRFSIRR